MAKKPDVTVYLRQEVKDRLPELVKHFSKDSGSNSVSGLIEWMLSLAILDMEREKKVVIIPSSTLQMGGK